MRSNAGFERLLVDWLESEGPQNVPERVVAAALADAQRTRQVRRGLAAPVVGSFGDWPVRRGSRAAWLVLAAALAAALTVGAVVAGQLNRRSLLGPPGLIAFSVEGKLMLSNPDGSERHAVEGAGAVAFSPTWSPDGRTLAFWSGGSWDDPLHNLVVTDARGGGTRTIASNLPWPTHLSWSPDSRQITFGANDRLTGIAVSIVYVVDVETARLRHVPTRDLIAFDPQWSPTEDRILFVGHGFDQENGLYVMRPDGTDLTRVTHRVMTDYYLKSFAEASWSPDGTHVTYFAGDEQHDIWVAAIDGTDEHAISTATDDELWPRWSPDGSSIAWVRGTDPRMELVVSDPDGSNERVISTGYPVIESMPEWAPDASAVMVPVFNPGADRADRLAVFDPNGIAAPRLVALEGDSSTEPSWQRRP